jgi:hypothetical protein
MNRQYGRTIQDTFTTLAPADVLAAAKRFFAERQGIYAAFPEKEGPTYVNLRGQGGEEVVIGVAADPRGVRVTGSSYLFDMQVAQFLGSLPAAPDAAPCPPRPSTRSRPTRRAWRRATPRRRAGRASRRRRRPHGRRRAPRRLARLTRPAAA